LTVNANMITSGNKKKVRTYLVDIDPNKKQKHI
jgi:hypothetical protein